MQQSPDPTQYPPALCLHHVGRQKCHHVTHNTHGPLWLGVSVQQRGEGTLSTCRRLTHAVCVPVSTQRAECGAPRRPAPALAPSNACTDGLSHSVTAFYMSGEGNHSVLARLSRGSRQSQSCVQPPSWDATYFVSTTTGVGILMPAV